MPPDEEGRANPLLAFAQPWLEALKQTEVVGRGVLQAYATFCDHRSLRQLWLGHMSQAADRYLRSPEFIRLMHQSLAVVNRSAQLSFKSEAYRRLFSWKLPHPFPPPS
jgi:hypothetical protein